MIKEDSLVSIVIPVFNVKPYLAEALDSAIHQTYENIEILIIDDGSTDGSGAICDEYLQKDARVRVVHQENKGLSNARNVGLRLMTGNAVAFLDSDDVYHPDFIASLMETMTREKADVVLCRYTFHNTTGTIKTTGGEKLHPAAQHGEYDRIAALRALVEKKINVSVWNKLYRRELWEEIRFPDGHIYEDIDTSFRVLDACKTVYVIDQPLYCYRKRPGSITDTCSLKNTYDRYLARDHFESFVEARTPDVFSIEQLMKRRQATLNILFGMYLQHPSKALRSIGVTDDELKKKIQEEVGKIGLKNCSPRKRAAYWMLCLCPSLLRIIYSLKHHMRLLAGKITKK